MSGPTPDWLQEIDLDPASSPNAMGTRALGQRPWLVADEKRADELALKAKLCTHRHREVFSALPGTDVAGESVAELIEREGVTVHEDPALHPLDRAGRRVQEDLCLMNRRTDGWYLVAGSLCFPSRWTLSDKIGRHVTAVHAPVRGYKEELAERVDRLFDRLTAKPVWRRNWFVHPNPDLFQPTRPLHDPVVAAEDALSSLFLRSERQTLRSIEPAGWILFTIKTQQVALATLAADEVQRRRFVVYLNQAAADHLRRRGMTTAQVDELSGILRRP